MGEPIGTRDPEKGCFVRVNSTVKIFLAGEGRNMGKRGK
jgi:hypothetical protein